MRLSRTPLAAFFLLLLVHPGLLCQSASPRQQVAAIAKPAAAEPPDPAAGKEASAPSRVLFFYTAPRSSVELEVHSIPPSSRERLDHLRDAFRAAGCAGDRMQEERVVDKHGEAGTNLICTWSASGVAGSARADSSAGGTIVVAAHYEHQGQGEGALADWSGAALLPFLYQALQGQPRENEFIFLESWKAQGAETWLRSLSRERRQHIRAMIDVDALGLGATRYFTTFSFMETPTEGAVHLQTELLWAAIDDGLTAPPEMTSPHRWLAQDSTDPFRAKLIPTIVIHSVPPNSSHLPGSPADVASTVDGNAYFQSYRLMCTYLASLDRMAKKLNRDDPVWSLPHYQEVPSAEVNPRVTFKQYGSWRSTH
jgi:hypothetical protein